MKERGLLKFLWLTLALALIFFGRAGDLWAKYSPEISWEGIETPHFRIYSPQNAQAFSRRLGKYLEEAYTILSQELRWAPSGPIEVVVRTDSDVSNGLTSVFPLNRIIVNAVPFSPFGDLSAYDDWVRALAIHELTHLVVGDSSHGVFSAGRWIFGSASKPNLFLPRWFDEGLAVYEETLHSLLGRGRSAYFDMVIRADVRDGALGGSTERWGETLDRINDGPPAWPGTLSPYIYGYAMIQHLASTRGHLAPADVVEKNSARIPMFFSGAYGETRKSWDELVLRLRSQGEKDLVSLRATPITPFQKLTSVGRLSRGPVFQPEAGVVYFIRDSYLNGTGLSTVQLDGKKGKDVSTWDFEGGNQLRSVSGGVLYSRMGRFEEFNFFSDAYVWDLRAGKEVALTHGARAVDPDASEDFAWNSEGVSSGRLAYVKNLGDGNQALAVWDGKTERILFRGENFERVSFPAWGRGPHKDQIAFAVRKIGGFEEIVLSDRMSGQIWKEFESGDPHATVSGLSWTSKGELLFSVSLNGIFNFYRIGQRNSRPVAMTRSETGFFFPSELSTGKTLGTVYSSRGFDVAVIESEEQKSSPGIAGSIYEKLGGKPTSDNSATDRIQPKARDYSVWPAILPQYWFPYGHTVPDGWELGASTSGADALDLHRYEAQLGWDSRAKFPVYALHYGYDGLYPTIDLSRIQENKYFGLSQTSNRGDTTALRFTYPIDDFSVSMGGTWEESRFFDLSSSSAGLQARLAYSTLRGFPASIDSFGGEAGVRAELGLSGYLVGDENFSALEATLEGRAPTFGQHFLKILLNGARSTNKNISSLYFLGGGETQIAGDSNFLLRGYESGSIFGRTLVTANAEYWLPFWELFRGTGAHPLFFERTKLKFFADTGSAEFVRGGQTGFSSWPVGIGAHLLQDFRFLYRLPFTVALGFDWGLSKGLGGEKQLVLGLFGRLGD